MAVVLTTLTLVPEAHANKGAAIHPPALIQRAAVEFAYASTNTGDTATRPEVRPGRLDPRLRLARREFVAFVIAYVYLAVQGLTYRAFMRQPFLRVELDEPIAFGACVILINYLTPPLDHLLLDRNRARRGGMNGNFQTTDIVLQAGLFGQF